MPISKRLLVMAACLPALTIHGQQRQVSGPIAGYVFDGTALRPIAGVPGGATLGDALNLGFAPRFATVSPQLDSAIAAGADGSVHVFRLSGATAGEVDWSGAPRGAERAVFSPSGTAAAIYAEGRVHVISGLPNSPAVAFSVAATFTAEHARATASAAPTAMAVSDDAAWLLLASAGSVRLLGESGSSGVIVETASAVSLAFAPSGHGAAILNGAGPTLAVYADIATAPAQTIGAPGLSEPVGVAFSTDGKQVLAANRSGQSIAIFDLAGGTSTSLLCACTPTGIARLGKMFRLTEAASGPVWLVDMSATPARIVFVPARNH